MEIIDGFRFGIGFIFAWISVGLTALTLIALFLAGLERGGR